MLMATWDGAGNFPPERALVRALVARRHDVHVLAHDVQRAAIEADGATFVGIESAPQIDCAQPGIDATMVEQVFAAPGIGADLAAAVGRIRPDVLLIDGALLTALAAARASKIPTVALGHTIYSFIEGTPFKAPAEACQLVLAFSYRAFDPNANPPAHVAYVGPLRPPDGALHPWRRKQPDRPLVVASLSTSHQEQEALLQRLCNALSDLDVEALVTTGRAIAPATLIAGPNVTVVRHVAHEAVLRETDLLITHAGHGTAMAGATFGVPMLCLPMGRDQPMIAERVVDLGLGLRLPADAAEPKLRDTILALLGDASVKDASRRFARQVAGESNAELAAELVEAAMLRP
jgi:UDP:flavonoid glycosyltransferase YjiC (YdhE family)